MAEKEKQEEPSEAEKPAEMPAAPELPLLMPPAIAAALVKLQGEVKTVIKGAKNAHYGNTYAELADVQNAALPLLSKHKLALTQWVMSKDGKHFLRSYLVHESGVGVMHDTDLLLVKNDPQGLGSAITYQRRQTTMAILGLSAEDDDDDGNKAANRQAKPTDEQISEIRQLCVDLKFPKEQIDTRLVSLRTEDHATVAIANLRKLVSEKARILRNDETPATPVFTGDRDQVVPNEIIVKTSGKDDVVLNLQRHMLDLPISDKARRNLVGHVTGSKFGTSKPFLKNCTAEEITAIAEAVEEIKAGTYDLPPEWTDDSITPPVETA